MTKKRARTNAKSRVKKAVNRKVESLQRGLTHKATEAKGQLDDVLLGLTHKVQVVQNEKIKPHIDNGRIQAQTVAELAMNIAHGLVDKSEKIKDSVQRKPTVRKAKLTAKKTKRKIQKALHR